MQISVALNPSRQLHCCQEDGRAGLAQLVEHLICNQGVADSSSATGTILSKYFFEFGQHVGLREIHMKWRH